MAKPHPQHKPPTSQPLKPVAALMQDAFRFTEQGKPALAIAACKKVLDQTQVGETAESAGMLWIKLSPEDAQGWSLLGYVLFQNAKATPAEQALDIALRLNPKQIDAYNFRAMLQKRQGFLYEALQSYGEALAIDPTHKKTRINRINVLLEMGLWDEAKEDIDALLKKEPQSSVLLALAGRYHAMIQDYPTALDYLQNALSRDPGNLSLLINLTGCLGKTAHDPDKLYQAWKKTYDRIMTTPEGALYQGEMWNLRHFMAMHDKNPIDKADIIIRARNLDDVTLSEPNIETHIVDASRRLYRFKDYYTHTEEWTLYNDDHIFANLMVVGSKKHANFSDDGDCYLSESLFPQIYLRGPHILLGGAENYYHWWIDFLPRMGVIQDMAKVMPELNDFPIIVLDSLNKGQLAALEKIGITADRLVHLPVGHTIKCDDLIVPHLLGRPMAASGLPDWMKPMVNDWGINWVRETYADWRQPKPGTPKRIFISRANSAFRRCINEDEVYAIAQRYGFTTLQNENLSFADQMAVYAGAEMVMGPHGAGFTNLLFAPETATVIEMFPKHRAPPFYREMCGQLGQRYIKFDGPITRLLPKMSVDFGDFYIDPADVERVLSGL